MSRMPCYTLVCPWLSITMISVFTAAYNSGDKIFRCLDSLLAQDHNNWEWVIMDDSDDERESARIASLAARDPRIRVLRMPTHSGSIGDVKHRACLASKGDILVELDHDDELTTWALSEVRQAFSDSGVGFAYSDWAEQFIDGSPAVYGSFGAPWGFGFGHDRWEVYQGRRLVVHEAPEINDTTIRYIESAPNHVRAWRRDVYARIGGHDQAFEVADDYELVVRTFLDTRMVRIPRLCYIQWYNTVQPGAPGYDPDANTQRARNARIQELSRQVSETYSEAISRRFVSMEAAV